ncbi:hypothetical protein BJ138DRAFT_200327, partial [Hygrophoropsis aurantiaca]
SETLCDIINYLPIGSILALRQVSKYLNQVTHDRPIWAHAYRTSSLVRPPGPFTWQTAQILESNLIQSAQLSLNWAPNPDAKPIRSRTTNLGSHRAPFGLICGRWLVVIKDPVGIVCYDLDRTENLSAEEPYSILCETPDNDTVIRTFKCESVPASERSGTEDRNPLAFLVMAENNDATPNSIRRTLYSVNLSEESPPGLTVVLQTNTESLDCQLTVGLKYVAVYDHAVKPNAILLDLETYQQYELPETVPKSDEGHPMFLQHIIISSTHVLVFWVDSHPFFPNSITGSRIEAYITPPPQGSNFAALAGQALCSAPITLHLSHEDTMTAGFGYCSLLRDSKINQLTDTIDIPLAAYSTDSKAIHALRVKLSPRLQGIGSITLDTSVSDPCVLPLMSFWVVRFSSSFNGSTRGIATTSMIPLHTGWSMRVAAFVLDDEDKANTRTAVDQDMRFFRELELDCFAEVMGFDANRGRIVTRESDMNSPFCATATVFDFI